MGHGALGMEKRQGRQGRGGRQGRDLFNNSPFSPCPLVSPASPAPDHAPSMAATIPKTKNRHPPIRVS
jgi:hypothetical protein